MNKVIDSLIVAIAVAVITGIIIILPFHLFMTFDFPYEGLAVAAYLFCLLWLIIYWDLAKEKASKK